MDQLCDSREHSPGNLVLQEEDGVLKKTARPPIPPKPKQSFPAQLEGLRSKLIGLLAETFGDAIPAPKSLPEFDFWILIFGESRVYNGQLINSVLKDERMRFPVLDTLLTTTDLTLLEQKWMSKGHPTSFIINARLPNANIENSTLDQLTTFIERKRRSWTQRIYIIISTTNPTDVVCNGYAGRFQKYLYVPFPTSTLNLKWFAIVTGCFDPFDNSEDEKDDCPSEGHSVRTNGNKCFASFVGCFCNCLFFCFGEC